MADICGIDAKTIREVARAFGCAERAMIFWGMGISQHVHGTDNARCLIALALMCGQVGRPGTGLHPLRGQNNVQGASDAGLIPMFYPDYADVTSEEIHKKYEALWRTPLSKTTGLTVVEIINAANAGKIRGMYIQGENPAMSDPDLDHARAGIAKLEHLVVQDIFLTETAMMADVVLPSSAWPEKTGTVTNTNRQVQMGRKALGLPGDTRDDLWIIVEMAKRLGLDWTYTHPSEVFAEMKLAMPSLDNITWERLERESSIIYPCPEPDHPGEAIVFGDGFPTKSGRAKLVPADILPPAEVPDHEYPLVLMTGRQLEHWHTGAMTRRAEVLDLLEPGPTASSQPRNVGPLRRGARPNDAGDHATGKHRAYCPCRPTRPGGYDLHPVRLCGGGGERAHQSAARSDREDPRVQILRREDRALSWQGTSRGRVQPERDSVRPVGLDSQHGFA